jgi:sporulation protein YlmC with PRC-barrel domain
MRIRKPEDRNLWDRARRARVVGIGSISSSWLPRTPPLPEKGTAPGSLIEELDSERLQAEQKIVLNPHLPLKLGGLDLAAFLKCPRLSPAPRRLAHSGLDPSGSVWNYLTERYIMSTTTVETHPNVLSTSAIIGDSVVNRAGESLGKIEEIMLDLEKGRVAYAVLSFGGVTEMGEKLYVIPFEALKLDNSREHFMLDVDKAKLKNAPSFDRNNPPQASDRTWGAEVYKFYGYKPYWQ